VLGKIPELRHQEICLGRPGPEAIELFFKIPPLSADDEAVGRSRHRRQLVLALWRGTHRFWRLLGSSRKSGRSAMALMRSTITMRLRLPWSLQALHHGSFDRWGTQRCQCPSFAWVMRSPPGWAPSAPAAVINDVSQRGPDASVTEQGRARFAPNSTSWTHFREAAPLGGLHHQYVRI
jgi:hypothetical protein